MIFRLAAAMFGTVLLVASVAWIYPPAALVLVGGAVVAGAFLYTD